MEPRVTVHIVDGDSRSRAEQARTVFALGHHAEVYSDLDELLEQPPHEGVILLRQRVMDMTLAEVFGRLGADGIWLPVVISSEDPKIERVVGAIKNGALDYLQLPIDPGTLARSLDHVLEEAAAHGEARRRTTEARRRVAALSKREREVLERLSYGRSNKIIARELGISPRTVEIHRANMMTKLRAGHAAEAVRVWLQAGLESSLAAAQAERGPAPVRGFRRQNDFAEAFRQRMPGVLGEDELDDPQDEEGEGFRRRAGPGRFRP